MELSISLGAERPSELARVSRSVASEAEVFQAVEPPEEAAARAKLNELAAAVLTPSSSLSQADPAQAPQVPRVAQPKAEA